MMNYRLGTVVLLAFCSPSLLLAGPMGVSVDEKTQSYTITDAGQPVLTYRFGEAPLPDGVEAGHFGKGATPYSSAYFTDGSRYGGQRSDYIHPLYGFHGETLTEDYPKDHLHHRGLWWSWCEVRHNEKIGDLWAVCKIRAYPVKIVKMEADADHAVLQAAERLALRRRSGPGCQRDGHHPRVEDHGNRRRLEAARSTLTSGLNRWLTAWRLPAGRRSITADTAV